MTASQCHEFGLCLAKTKSAFKINNIKKCHVARRSNNSPQTGFVFAVSRKSVLEAELVHDFIFRRLELPWAAVPNGENIRPGDCGAK